MSRVILKGFIIVPPNDLTAVKDDLDNHIQLTRAETGCLIFKVTQDALNPCRFDVYEEFVDETAFQAHQTRVTSSRWGKITINVERFYTVTESTVTGMTSTGMA
ncbi:putative quinol monooxygenase [Aeromonas finlandensis]|uniref:putative quinol monooxygenase n=1 Tax=Aeromonas finlandensis TaxID=1543375 RepID=UPI0009DE9E69|nr:antibiotic biosynthesis monooxygenase [Aeromonas finlandensis]